MINSTRSTRMLALAKNDRRDRNTARWRARPSFTGRQAQQFARFHRPAVRLLLSSSSFRSASPARFAVLGAWLILPFAGLEMLVLYLAFRYIDRHAGDYERIAIDGDRVEVELCEAGRRGATSSTAAGRSVVTSGDGSGSRCARTAARSRSGAT